MKLGFYDLSKRCRDGFDRLPAFDRNTQVDYLRIIDRVADLTDENTGRFTDP